MSRTRTLPIRTNLLNGEAIDSWLEAVAARSDAAFGDLLHAVGIKAPNTRNTGTWVNSLGGEQSKALSVATGVPENRLFAATISIYWGIAIPTEVDTGRPGRIPAGWHMSGSRFCPACLRESGGRWPLAWRLGCTFACIKHRCLLADNCPQCGSVPRQRQHPDSAVPKPNRCAIRASKGSLGSGSICLADLTNAEVPLFGTGHPVLEAQQVVNEILECQGSTFGVYGLQPQPAIDVLMDVYAVARRALSRCEPGGLAAIVPKDLLDLYRDQIPSPEGLKRNAGAVRAAVGVVAAMHVLNRPDIETAADSVRWLTSPNRKSGHRLRPWGAGSNTGPSAVLTAIQLTAQSHILNAPEQLRNRLGTTVPRHPRLTKEAIDILAPKLPTVLWQAWSIRLSIPGHQFGLLRQALSAAVLLVDSQVPVEYVLRATSNPLAEAPFLRALWLLRKNRRWPAIRTALTSLASYIATNDVPIDYRRRRQLDYATLLPDDTWSRICRDSGVFGARASRARVVRCFLFEMLSGLPADLAPFAPNDSAFRSRVADFPRHLNVDVQRFLEEHSLQFLARQGVHHEPTSWHPPTHLINGLDLPGADPESFDPATLYEIARDNAVRLSDGALLLGIDIEAARYLLATNPAPASAWLNGDEQRPSQLGAYRIAKEDLSPDRFNDRYHKEGMSLRKIASATGVCKYTIRKIALEYGVKLRPAVPVSKRVVEREWLYEEYVNKLRTISDIAKEIGMNPSNLLDWANKLKIPLRGRGPQNQRVVLAARVAASNAPTIIRPALAAIGGWNRLQRFAVVANHRSLRDAQRELGIRQDVLTKQIGQIESELGMTLLIRARRGEPMQLTDDGRSVLEAIRVFEASGDDLSRPVPLRGGRSQATASGPILEMPPDTLVDNRH